MLGPLKFGLQKTPLAVAPAPGRFALTLSLEGDSINILTLGGPTGATAFIDWGDNTSSSIVITGGGNTISDHSCGSTATITGSNLISLIRIRQYDSNKLKGIIGTYPTSLDSLKLSFNYADPVFTPPNVSVLYFFGSSGPSSLTTGSKLTILDFLQPNLTSLNLSASTKITTFLLSLPPGLTTFSPPPSITSLNVSGSIGLTSLTVPSKVTSLNISNCTALTTVTLPPALTTLRMEGSGLTSLDLSKTNVSILNIPPSMDTQLKSVNFGTKLKPSGIFRFEVPEDGVWTLY